MTEIGVAKKIMGRNFIGPDELLLAANKLGIGLIKKTPEIQFPEKLLRKIAKEYILILGVAKDASGLPLTINRMRSLFGVSPDNSEPCFYNQDWYLKEKFAAMTTMKNRWYLIRKNPTEESRGRSPEQLTARMKTGENLPAAVLTAFAFLTNFLLGRGVLWKNDFIWCSDRDSNGDRIYTGRYVDPKKINKNGFSVHRHLSIRPCYGVAPEIVG